MDAFPIQISTLLKCLKRCYNIGMNKRDNRLKELKRLKYLCNEVIKAEKKKLKKIRDEERLILNDRRKNKRN